MLFTELNLKPSSLKAIEELGFTEPTEIQAKSIPILMQEEDIDFIGQAQTGTGKTAAFTLPLLEKLDFSSKDIQAIILAPTRELANQICQEIKKLSRFEPVRTLAVYGGVPISGQIRELKGNKPTIVVGTPGRTLDLLKRKALRIENCRFAILDEADEMLDMGFFDDVTEIINVVENKKIWMFSATMPKPILSMINNHFCDPQLVKVTKKILTSDSIDQQFCVVRRRDQAEALCRYLDYKQDIYAIVFCRTKVGVKQLTDELNLRGFPSDALHGDMSQDQRDLTMRKFKAKKINLLVCTDVAARGIDVADLTHVINFSLPQDNESYVHRIGRTGRGGSKGIALSIIEPGEQRRVRDIERITKAKIEKIELPKLEEIVSVLREKSIAEFDKSIAAFDSEDEETFKVFKERYAETSNEDILKAVYSFVFDQSLKRYKNAGTLESSSNSSKDREPREPREGGARRGGAQAGYERFFVNIGQSGGVNPGSLVKFIATTLNVKGSEIGRIDVKPTFSFFEMPTQYTESVLGLASEKFDNKSINIEVASKEGGERRGGGGGGGDRRGGGARRGGPRSDSRSDGGSGGAGGNRRSGSKSFSRSGSREGAREGNRAGSGDGNRASRSDQRGNS